MALQGFDKTYYLNAKLAALVAAGETEWSGKTAADLEATLQNVYGISAEDHYAQYGYAEGLAPNAYFNADEYKLAKATALFNDNLYLTIEDALAAFEAAWTGDAYNHYLQYGGAEGLNPSNSFDESSYLADKLAALQAADPTNWDATKTVADVKAAFEAAGFTALGHYVEFGATEGLVATEVPASEQVDAPTDVPAAGDTLTLTTAAETVTGTTLNDLIVGDYVVNPSTGLLTLPTLGAFDSIDGGKGTDTLSVTVQESKVGGYTLPGATITNVENLVINSDSGAVAADVQAIAGLNSIAITNGTASNVDVDTKSNITSVTLSKASADTDTLAAGAVITDNGTSKTTADALTSVTLNGTVDGDNTTTDVVTISSDALSTLSLADTAIGATVTAAAGTRALTVNLDNVTGGTVTDGNATSATIVTADKKSSGVTLTINKATAVTVDAAVDLAATLNANVAKTIDVNGAGKVTATAGTLAALESVNAADNTGGVVLSLGTAVSFTGGSGADALTVGATTKAQTLGAGDDTFVASVAAGTGGSIDGGEGTDTVAMASAAAATLSAATAFEADIANFEKVSIGATGAADTVNLSNLDDINYLISAGVTAGGLTVTNMANGGTFEQTGVIGTASSVAVKDAATGASDVLNIKLNGAANLVNTAATTVSSVETINIITADTTKTADPAAASTLLLNAADATKVTVTGNHGVDFTGSTLTKVTELDASGVVGTGTTAAAIGNAGAVTFSSVVTDKAVTITTGNGADVISTASVNDATFLATKVTASTISTGEGNDTITGSDGMDVIDAGAGNDTITAGAGADTLTGGAGNDTFAISAGTDSTLLNLDTITDFTANTYGNGTSGAAGTGAGAVANWTGDVLQFTVAAAVLADGAYVSVQSNASDAQTYLQNLGADVAGATDNAFGAALDSSSGKLYVDLNSDGTVDSVIELTGVSTIDAAAIVLV